MFGDMIDQMMGDSTEVETKVDVEEASVNFNCVKNELAEEVVKLEENLHVTQYRVTLKDIFEVVLCKRNFEESDDNLIGFLDNDAVMENTVIKLGGSKEEDRSFDYCNKCKGDYKGFCLKCSTLSHILNSASPPTSLESQINTVPEGILEIRDFSVERGIFVLKALPKNIILGPFEGVSAMKGSKGDGWKINNKRLENVENGNWMKDIAYATSVSIRNLDIFQMNGNLYFQTNREIMEGEELLVYYDDEEVEKLDDSQECYFIPRKQESCLPKIFACTRCCLGFRLFKCLMEHKSKCPHAECNIDIKDFEVVECHNCKVCLEKQEYQEYHMGYCSERYLRFSYRHAQPVNRNQIKVDEIDRLDTEAVHGGFNCSQCSYETNDEKNLQKHLNTHKKAFQCDICVKKFTTKGHLKRHIKDKHRENGNAKDYQCSECNYQTNYKHDYQRHLNGHRDIKPYECGICQMKFTEKQTLTKHIKYMHTENGCAKDYQCSECTYQTNYKNVYRNHLNRHRGIKPFECGTCKMKFTEKRNLKKHIKEKHTENGGAKNYQCSECSYQTNYKSDYRRHLNVHSDIKPFECDICKMKFARKDSLKSHLKNIHKMEVS